MADAAGLSELVVDVLRKLHATHVDAASLRQERDAFRLIAVAGFHLAHAQQVELAQLRRRYERVLDEYRAYRSQPDRRRSGVETCA